MGNKTRIKITLSVYGENFEPFDLDSLMELSNSSFYKKGELIPNRKNLLRKNSGWEFSTGFKETLVFEELTDIFLENLRNKEGILFQFVTDKKISVKIYIVVEIIDEEKPAMFFNRNFLRFVNEINAEIDMDMYLF